MLFNALANMCIKYIHPLVRGNPPMIEQFPGGEGNREEATVDTVAQPDSD